MDITQLIHTWLTERGYNRLYGSDFLNLSKSVGTYLYNSRLAYNVKENSLFGSSDIHVFKIALSSHVMVELSFCRDKLQIDVWNVIRDLGITEKIKVTTTGLVWLGHPRIIDLLEGCLPIRSEVPEPI